VAIARNFTFIDSLPPTISHLLWFLSPASLRALSSCYNKMLPSFDRFEKKGIVNLRSSSPRSFFSTSFSMHMRRSTNLPNYKCRCSFSRTWDSSKGTDIHWIGTYARYIRAAVMLAVPVYACIKGCSWTSVSTVGQYMYLVPAAEIIQRQNCNRTVHPSWNSFGRSFCILNINYIYNSSWRQA